MQDFDVLSAFQLSIACLHNSHKYYEAFKQTNDVRNKSDLTIFIIEFLEIYLQGLEELKESLEITKAIYNQMQVKIEKHFSGKQLDILNLMLIVKLFGSETLTMNQLVLLNSHNKL